MRMYAQVLGSVSFGPRVSGDGGKKSMVTFGVKVSDGSYAPFYVQCCAFGAVAAFVEKMVTPGQQVLVMGKVRMDPNGRARADVLNAQVIVQDVKLVGRNDEDKETVPP